MSEDRFSSNSLDKAFNSSELEMRSFDQESTIEETEIDMKKQFTRGAYLKNGRSFLLFAATLPALYQILKNLIVVDINASPCFAINGQTYAPLIDKACYACNGGSEQLKMFLWQFKQQDRIIEGFIMIGLQLVIYGVSVSFLFSLIRKQTLRFELLKLGCQTKMRPVLLPTILLCLCFTATQYYFANLVGFFTLPYHRVQNCEATNSDVYYYFTSNPNSQGRIYTNSTILTAIKGFLTFVFAIYQCTEITKIFKAEDFIKLLQDNKKRIKSALIIPIEDFIERFDKERQTKKGKDEEFMLKEWLSTNFKDTMWPIAKYQNELAVQIQEQLYTKVSCDSFWFQFQAYLELSYWFWYIATQFQEQEYWNDYWFYVISVLGILNISTLLELHYEFYEQTYRKRRKLIVYQMNNQPILQFILVVISNWGESLYSIMESYRRYFMINCLFWVIQYIIFTQSIDKTAAKLEKANKAYYLKEFNQIEVDSSIDELVL